MFGLLQPHPGPSSAAYLVGTRDPFQAGSWPWPWSCCCLPIVWSFRVVLVCAVQPCAVRNRLSWSACLAPGPRVFDFLFIGLVSIGISGGAKGVDCIHTCSSNIC